MFTTRKSDRLKLIDFGLAAKLDPHLPVKVTTGTPEFAAPEVVTGRPVGFSADMWALGVLSYILLSGMSPFGGEDDEETLANVRACDWNFDTAFDGISEQARNFISRLLVPEQEERMTVHAALKHPWLAHPTMEGVVGKKELPSEQFHTARDAVRSRYDSWPEPHPPLGRVANYSSLRTQRPTEYRIHEAVFEEAEAQPRFVSKPHGASCAEGQGASFFVKILSPTPVSVRWMRDGVELDAGRYVRVVKGTDYALTINGTTVEDRGEYMVRAENEFGYKEVPFFLNVLRVAHRGEAEGEGGEGWPAAGRRTPRPQMVMEVPEYREEMGPPHFTFHLRPRLIQKNHPCKLLCTLGGNPPPKVSVGAVAIY